MFGNIFRSEKKQMLPLGAWAVVITLAVLVFGGLGAMRLPGDTAFLDSHEMRYANYKVRLHNLIRNEVVPEEAYHVIIFGSSLTAQGVLRDSFFEHFFQQLGKPVHVNRVFYAGASYKMLEDPDLLAYLENARPDLLCIEDQVLFFEPLPELDWPNPLPVQFQKRYVHNLNVLKHRLLPSAFPKPGLKRQIDSTITFDVRYKQADSVISHRDSIQFEIQERSVRKRRYTRKFNRLAEQLTDSGTDLVILNLPRPAAIEGQYMSERELRRRVSLLEAYRQRFEVDYWTFERPLPFRFYWDISHLNKYGQQIYSEWLAERIEQHYNGSAADSRQ
ncbi:hypothetical protein [Flavilitoribacter nigricans]|uniref:Uncharacterized protein n=1 Tax=Flavilitoribacter nigricans (strain ATCC 23147 / DSM 23189 / NBRC 102662 / NCIMB 1420 / SS-2) TaxID=1122177 RepID=A0A2D0N3N1_FLAN2|nr:hypothetical protein [Flavilitoribacter nigricans]PHN03131.1 hypothetical protein CRP01_29065 [Flavilitoribacter nigricans DSM 23189 = NBRC 102662]